MQNKRLIQVYMIYLAIGFAVLMCLSLINVAYRTRQYEKRELFEKARLITEQFQSMRLFMAAHQVSANEEGSDLAFGVLNPAVVGKGVSDIFNSRTEYSIRQIRLVPRNPGNLPDEYEREKLLLFSENREIPHVWEETVYEGKPVFRYIVPVHADASCLSCHGEPAGEPDASGHPREGFKEGDLAGAISVIVPAQSYYEALKRSVIVQSMWMFAFYMVILGMIYLLQRNLVTLPLENLSKLALQAGRGDFSFLKVKPQKKGYGEIRILERAFHKMSRELSMLYADLEQKVMKRTRDLEEEKSKLKAMNEELTKMNRLQSEFLANVSHELRTPLSCILALTELLQDEQATPEERRQNLGDIKESGEKLLALINALLDTAKLDAGMMKIYPDTHDVRNLVDSALQLVLDDAKKKDIEVEVEIDPQLKTVTCDMERMVQVLFSLLNNAVKFSYPGGKVVLKAGLTPENRVYLSVADEGLGMEEEELKIIFERFRQSDQPGKKYKGGTGLGLYRSKKLVELHGGTLSASSTPGKGATFTVILPKEAGNSG